MKWWIIMVCPCLKLTQTCFLSVVRPSICLTSFHLHFTCMTSWIWLFWGFVSSRMTGDAYIAWDSYHVDVPDQTDLCGSSYDSTSPYLLDLSHCPLKNGILGLLFISLCVDRPDANIDQNNIKKSKHLTQTELECAKILFKSTWRFPKISIWSSRRKANGNNSGLRERYLIFDRLKIFRTPLGYPNYTVSGRFSPSPNDDIGHISSKPLLGSSRTRSNANFICKMGCTSFSTARKFFVRL